MVRDPIFWVWVFFMTVTSVTTVVVTVDSEELLSILLVSWASATVVYWFIPAIARQLWRQRRRGQAESAVNVTHFPPAG